MLPPIVPSAQSDTHTPAHQRRRTLNRRQGRTMNLKAERARTRNTSAPERTPAQRWTLIAVCGATFMLLVDLMVVQVALPTIQREVGGSFTDLQWVIDAYALTLAAFILAFGSAADRFGRRRVFVTGVAVF